MTDDFRIQEDEKDIRRRETDRRVRKATVSLLSSTIAKEICSSIPEDDRSKIQYGADQGDLVSVKFHIDAMLSRHRDDAEMKRIHEGIMVLLGEFMGRYLTPIAAGYIEAADNKEER